MKVVHNLFHESRSLKCRRHQYWQSQTCTLKKALENMQALFKCYPKVLSNTVNLRTYDVLFKCTRDLQVSIELLEIILIKLKTFYNIIHII